ncbi:MAG: LolA family protein [Chloroflexota bacterium]
MKLKIKIAILALCALSIGVYALSAKPAKHSKSKKTDKAATAAKTTNSTNIDPVENYLAARNADDFRKMNTIKIRGRIISRTMDIPFIYYYKKPSLFRIDESFMTVLTTRIFNGYEAKARVNGNITEIKAEDINRIIRLLDLVEGPLLNAKKNGYTYTWTDAADKPGMYKVELTNRVGAKTYHWLDKKDFLLKYSVGTPFVPDDTTHFRVDNYKPVGKLVLPFFIEVGAPESPQKYRIEEVEINPELNDSLFTFTK